MKKSLLLASAAHPLLGRMSAAEMAKGRYMRAPDGHEGAPAPAAAPAPAPAPSPAPAPAAEPVLELTTEQMLDNEFPEPGSGEPATPPASADANASGDPAPTGDSNQGQPKQGQTAEERIAELTGARREAERQAAEWRREAERLRAEAPAPAATGGQGEERDPNAEPKATDYEFGEADPKFIGDTSRWHARQEYAAQAEQAEFRSQIATMEAGWQSKIADPELIKQYPDFDEKVTKGAAEGKWDCSPVVALGIKNSEFGPDIAYHLATNTAEASRIAKLTPLEQAREFGRMEGSREAAKKAAAQPQPKPVTDAPTPPAGRARGGGGRFATEADTDDFAAFDKMADGILKG